VEQVEILVVQEQQGHRELVVVLDQWGYPAHKAQQAQLVPAVLREQQVALGHRALLEPVELLVRWDYQDHKVCRELVELLVRPVLVEQVEPQEVQEPLVLVEEQVQWVYQALRVQVVHRGLVHPVLVEPLGQTELVERQVVQVALAPVEQEVHQDHQEVLGHQDHLAVAEHRVQLAKMV
jgi:hypothetical protein